jgi:hypothetical protein
MEEERKKPKQGPGGEVEGNAKGYCLPIS